LALSLALFLFEAAPAHFHRCFEAAPAHRAIVFHSLDIFPWSLCHRLRPLCGLAIAAAALVPRGRAPRCRAQPRAVRRSQLRGMCEDLRLRGEDIPAAATLALDAADSTWRAFETVLGVALRDAVRVTLRSL